MFKNKESSGIFYKWFLFEISDDLAEVARHDEWTYSEVQRADFGLAEVVRCRLQVAHDLLLSVQDSWMIQE